MALEMRANCERCNGFLAPQGEAFICSYECTFCSTCTDAMNAVCPNCGGELLRRPRRNVRVMAIDQNRMESSTGESQ
jgi:hypothetical protein